MGAAMTRHCHNCGWVSAAASSPGRGDTCPQCRADLRVCFNCARYAENAAHQCTEPRAEPVADKDRANYCEWFSFAVRHYAPKTGLDRAAAARDALRKLLGD